MLAMVSATGAKGGLGLATAVGAINRLRISFHRIITAAGHFLQDIAHLVHPAALMQRSRIDGRDRRRQLGTTVGDDQQQVLAAQLAAIQILQQPFPGALALQAAEKLLEAGTFLPQGIAIKKEVGIRGDDKRQTAMFSYLTLEQRIPADHPARQIRELVDRALERMDGELEQLYSATGRPSIAPERLLRASLLMVLYSIRSERQLMEQLNYNLLFRWFVGLEMDDPVWDVTVFTKNRERLIAGGGEPAVAGGGVGRGARARLAERGALHGGWHADPGLGGGAQLHGEGRSACGRAPVPALAAQCLLRDKVESTTDPEARLYLYKKATADKSVPSYQGHALMEKRRVRQQAQPFA